MEFKKIGIIALIILLMCSFVMPVYAAKQQTTASTYWEQQNTGTSTYATTNLEKEVTQVDYNGTNRNFKYNTTDGLIYVSVFYIGKTPTTANGGYYYLIIWHNDTLTLNGTSGNVKSSSTFNYKKAVTLDEVNNLLFNNQVTTITIDGSGTSTYVFQPVILEDTAYTGTKYSGSEGNPELVATGIEEYYINNNICQHTNVVKSGENLIATTTTHGYTGDTICLDCGEITKNGEFIHKFNSNNVCYVCGVVEDNVSIGSNVINNKTYYFPAGYPTLTVIFGHYNDLIIWSPENTILKIHNGETWKVHYINEDGTASDSTTDYYYVTIDKNYSEYNFNYEDIVNTITNIETEYTNQESFYGYYYRAIVGKTIGARQGHNNFTAITIEELFGEHAEHIEDTPEVIPEPEEPEITPPTDEEGGIIGLLKTILEYLNPFNWIKASNGTLFFDKAGELINENLKNNKFYTSILSVRDSLMDLFNEDYTSRTGFYELGLTNITLGKPEEIVYIDQGNEVIGPWEQEVGKIEGTIDFGLDNVKVLNFDWYFGRDLGDGKYTKGMKPTIDNLISAFLWVMFAWALYKNMPNWISGELTQIGNLTNEAIYIGSKKVTTKLPTLEEKKKKDTSGMRKFEGTKTFDINPKTNKKGK